MMRLQDIHKAFGPHRVLRGVSLDVARGESLVIIGGSGTGKSVLLKCILGLIQPDQGQVLVDGTSGLDLNRTGVLFQEGALFDSLPIWENVAFRQVQGRMARSAAKDHAIHMLARVGLDADVADLYPAALSGGMRKRAGLARAMSSNPDLMFFDEPTTGLDPIMTGVITNLIRTTVADLGATAITISHDMRVVHEIADQVALLHDGQVHWTGTPAQMDASDNPYLRQFITGAAQGPLTPPGRDSDPIPPAKGRFET